VITHPNVVNASDINEMPENAWYVEGSILNRFLNGSIKLKQPLSNRILLVVNEITNELHNAVAAARHTIGARIDILKLDHPLIMIGKIDENGASGEVCGWEELVDQVWGEKFDALAIASPIQVSKEVSLNYFRHGGINPWGGVEAKASHFIADALLKPVAHAPTLDADPELRNFNEVVDPRMAAEVLSSAFVHCVFKGLHKAPRISDKGLAYKDVDCMITPHGCYGPPHKACHDAGIPVIVVKENTTCFNQSVPEDFIFVENYLEAAGYVMAMKAGIDPISVRGRALNNDRL